LSHRDQNPASTDFSRMKSAFFLRPKVPWQTHVKYENNINKIRLVSQIIH
jgi:hypothetical protein